MAHRKNAAQIIRANHLSNQQVGNAQSETLLEYAERCIESDPSFYRWFFEDDTIGDFGTGCTAAQEDELFTFLHEDLR